MTIDAFTNKLREAGVEANFDEKNKRFHIAAKKSGDVLNILCYFIQFLLLAFILLSYDEKTIKEYEKYKNMSEDEKKARYQTVCYPLSRCLLHQLHPQSYIRSLPA